MLGKYYIGTQVRRAWKTDPKVQFEVGTITKIIREEEITSPDVEIAWSGGSVTTELDCELVEVYAKKGVYKYDILSEVDKKLNEMANDWDVTSYGEQR